MQHAHTNEIFTQAEGEAGREREVVFWSGGGLIIMHPTNVTAREKTMRCSVEYGEGSNKSIDLFLQVTALGYG